VHIICQLDCLENGNRTRPEQPGGYLVEAIRHNWELSYPDDEPEALAGLLTLFSVQEREDYHQAALRLCSEEGGLFSSSQDAAAWPVEMRAVARFLVQNAVDPATV